VVGPQHEADGDQPRRPLSAGYLQKGHVPELQTAVAAAAVVAKSATSADAIVRILAFISSLPVARSGVCVRRFIRRQFSA
jgi:acyl-coenzyme A synthetase/AMP-(fatty) acid ligase